MRVFPLLLVAALALTLTPAAAATGDGPLPCQLSDVTCLICPIDLTAGDKVQEIESCVPE